MAACICRSEERRVGKERGSEGLIHIFVPREHTKNTDIVQST